MVTIASGETILGRPGLSQPKLFCTETVLWLTLPSRGPYAVSISQLIHYVCILTSQIRVDIHSTISSGDDLPPPSLESHTNRKEDAVRRHAPVALMLVFFAVLTSGCVASRAQYDIGLSDVERPATARERYGESEITRLEEEGLDKYRFEDDMIRIAWVVGSSSLSFVMENKTDHSIRVIWDEAAYVDPGGMSHRIMHSGVKYIDRSEPQPPTVVVRKGKIDDVIVPVDNVYFTGGYGGWAESPLLPISGYTAEQRRQAAYGYVGKSIQVLLPLQIEQVVNDYIFRFRINDVDLR